MSFTEASEHCKGKRPAYKDNVGLLSLVSFLQDASRLEDCIDHKIIQHKIHICFIWINTLKCQKMNTQVRWTSILKLPLSLVSQPEE